MDDLVFDPGDPITIRLVGDSQGGLDDSLWAAVDIDRSVLLDAHADTFAPQTNTTLLVGAARGCEFYFSRGIDRCGLMNYASQPGTPDFAIDPSTEPFTYAVLTATAGVPGVHTLNFKSSPISQRVDFFGLTSAPGITFTITGDPPPPPPLDPPTLPPVVTPPVVTPPSLPEPGSAALLALGLGGLAAARRRLVP